MRPFYLAILFVFVTGAALAADLVCTVPASNVARSVELCEELRLAMNVRTADWNNDVCATQFLRVGLLEGERLSSTRSARATVSNAVANATEGFKQTWPRPVGAECGDGILDTEFGETCDDGGNSVTCNGNCTPSACGDGFPNDAAGETCDDGNVTPGDGCDASCLIEP